jgi:hypothetical protein
MTNRMPNRKIIRNIVSTVKLFENQNKDKSENGELAFAYFKELGLAHRLGTTK